MGRHQLNSRDELIMFYLSADSWSSTVRTLSENDRCKERQVNSCALRQPADEPDDAA